ncbi:MAG TPA: carboxypeptidase-like regulatory domain-containing protein [Armatimonadota bacterium]
MSTQRDNLGCATTDDKGEATYICAAGYPLTVQLNGEPSTEKTVTLVAGQSAILAWTLKDPGLTIRVAFPDPRAVDASIYTKDSLAFARIAAGLYRPLSVPAGLKALALTAQYSDGLFARTVAKTWTLTDAVGPLCLRWELPHGVPVKIPVVDARGNPLKKTPLSGRVAQGDLDNAQPRWDGRWLDDVVTDATGTLSIVLPPGTYRLALRQGEHLGAEITFVVTDGKAVALQRYVIGAGERRVTETVYAADGTPAANCAMHASLAWAGRCLLRHASTDAHGVVVWEHFPALPAVIWGQDIPAGLLAADVTEATSLPPMPVGAKGDLMVRMPNGGLLKEGVKYYSADGGIGQSIPNPPYPTTFPPYEVYRFDCQPGTPFFTSFAPRHSNGAHIALLDLYPPSPESGDTLTVDAVWHHCELRGRLVDANGKPVTGVSRLRLSPLSEEWPWLNRKNGMPEEFLTPLDAQADGSFRIMAPLPGRYRLVVDLLDEHSPLLPALTVTLAEGVNQHTFTLPVPLAHVPAGTEFCWVRTSAPLSPQYLRVGATQPVMPVYGSTAVMLAYWYRPRPDQLVLWHFGADHTVQTLPLRAATLALCQAPGGEFTGPLHLLPFLPAPAEPANGELADLPAGHARAEAGPTRLSGEDAVALNLWPGAYLVGGDVDYRSGGGQPYFGLLTLPAHGASALTLPIDARKPWPAVDRWGEDGINAIFPAGDYAALRQRGAKQISIQYDQPVSRHYAFDAQYLRPGEPMRFFYTPLLAKTFTVQWLGVGGMRNVAIPAPVYNKDWQRYETPPVTLPAWEPGLEVSGRIISADGQPLCNARLAIGHNLVAFGQELNEAVITKTDALGHFRVAGVLPGTLFVMLYDNKEEAGRRLAPGWTLTVPESGLSEITLRVAAHPVNFYVGYCSLEKTRTAWWFPDEGGKPVQIPLLGEYCCSQQVKLGQGWLWLTGGEDGRAHYYHLDLTKRLDMIYNTQMLPQTGGPGLGVAFPLDAQAGIPGALALIGEGTRAGVRAVWDDMRWRPYPALGLVLGQIDAVPPGHYRLQVQTVRGRVEAPVTVTQDGGFVMLAYPPAMQEAAQ